MKNNIDIKPILLIVFFICNSIKVIAQEYNLFTYSITLNEEKNLEESFYDGVLPNLKKELETVKFELKITQELTEFEIYDLQNSSEDKIIAIISLCDMLGNKILSKPNSMTEYSTNLIFKDYKDYLIKSDIIYEWIITDEIKTINGVECKKALTHKVIKYDNGTLEKTQLLTAWFAPNIKLSNGPKCVTGLPGLILELQTPVLVFKIDSMRFEKKMKINFPEGKIMTFSQLYNLN